MCKFAVHRCQLTDAGQAGMTYRFSRWKAASMAMGSDRFAVEASCIASNGPPASS